MNWVDCTLTIAFVFGLLCLVGMLLYRRSHKTTIEMDLLIKQMRLAGRLRVLTGYQQERLDVLEKFCLALADQWEIQRSAVRARHNYDIGEFPEVPEPDANLTHLFSDVEV